MSGHWTDDRLIDRLYGIAPKDAHLESCLECQARLSQMRANRRAVDAALQENVSAEFLAAQRRQIYARLTEREGWFGRGQVRRFASAAAAVLVVAGGLLFYQGSRHSRVSETKMSDAQLAQEVSRMAEDFEPQATAPLQALFEE